MVITDDRNFFCPFTMAPFPGTCEVDIPGWVGPAMYRRSLVLTHFARSDPRWLSSENMQQLTALQSVRIKLARSQSTVLIRFLVKEFWNLGASVKIGGSGVRLKEERLYSHNLVLCKNGKETMPQHASTQLMLPHILYKGRRGGGS